MQITVEISLYPLTEDYVAPIEAFLEQCRNAAGVEVITSATSTRLHGDYDVVMALLAAAMRTTFEAPHRSAFVARFLEGDSRDLTGYP